jgi:arsenate reductase-like glutaredoxin family protein
MHVLVYSAPWCRDCREAKRFLEKHQISYTEIDIESTPAPQKSLSGTWASEPSLNS